jgi:hypothetical protein
MIIDMRKIILAGHRMQKLMKGVIHNSSVEVTWTRNKEE